MLLHSLQAQYHYELINQHLGSNSLKQLVESYVDTNIIRPYQTHSLLLHPSPIFHLRTLLKQLLSHQSPGTGVTSTTSPGAAGGLTVTVAQARQAFERLYGYSVPLRLIGGSSYSLGHLLRELEGDCRVEGDASGDPDAWLVKPPVPGLGSGASTFNKVRHCLGGCGGR